MRPDQKLCQLSDISDKGGGEVAFFLYKKNKNYLSSLVNECESS